MPSTELERDKRVTREVHSLFWRAMFYTPKYFLPTVVLYAPAFFIMQVFIPLQAAYGIQAIIAKNFDQVTYVAWYIIGLTLLGQLLNTVATWAFNRNGIYGGTYVQRTLFSNFLSKDYDFFSSHYIGALGSQAARIRDAFTDYNRLALFEIPRNAVVLLTSLIVVAVNSWLLAIIAVICISFALGITLFFSKYRLKYRRLVSRASGRVAGVIGDSLSHGQAVKSFANEDYERNRLSEPMKDWEHSQLKSWDLFLPQNFLRNFFMSVTMAVLLVVSAHLYKNHTIGIAIIVLVQLYVIRIINVTIDVADMVKQYELIMSTAYEALETSLAPTKVSDPEHPKRLGRRNKYSIGFKDVSYRYPEAGTKKYAVKDFSLHIEPGEKIGLVGYSGGGKTTITKLALRFMDVNEGSIEVGSLNLQEMKQADLRDLIAYVPQEPVLFHRSIKENIAYGRPDASEKNIRAVAKVSHVDEFIKEMPQGYDSLVGERGVKLSGGQRQRVAIARALLKDSSILVLDEATSSLDSQSERYIQKALWELMEDRTAIVIAHRLSTIQHMDRIVVMDKGSIVQSGSHQELLKNKHGIYAKLWAHQSDGYLAEA